MATGLRIPVGVHAGGGAALETGDPQNNKVIKLALGDTDNENAFQQDISMDAFMIFAVDGPEIQSRVIRRVRRIFEDFRRVDRFKLVEGSITLDKGDDGELILEFKYINLESDEEKTYREKLGR